MSKVYSRYNLPPKEASTAGERTRDTYKWTMNEKGEKKLIHDADIDRQAEIQSYAEECDIKNIVARAAFDPNFAQALASGAMDGSNIDITDYPENIHEFKKMAEKAGKTIEEITEEMNKPKQPEQPEQPEQKKEEEKQSESK